LPSLAIYFICMVTEKFVLLLATLCSVQGFRLYLSNLKNTKKKEEYIQHYMLLLLFGSWASGCRIVVSFSVLFDSSFSSSSYHKYHKNKRQKQFFPWIKSVWYINLKTICKLQLFPPCAEKFNFDFKTVKFPNWIDNFRIKCDYAFVEKYSHSWNNQLLYP
jgi:hypothetical protein